MMKTLLDDQTSCSIPCWSSIWSVSASRKQLLAAVDDVLLVIIYVSAVLREIEDPKSCPCKHGGTCVQEKGSDNITCVCPDGKRNLMNDHMHTLCETDILY